MTATPVGGPEGARAVAGRARGAVSLAFLVNGTAIGLWAAHIPMIQQAHGLDKEAVGFVILTIALGGMIAMPLAGWIIGRIGSRTMTVAGTAAVCGAAPLLALAPTVPALYAAALLFGLCNGLMDVAMNAHASDVETAWRRPTMSFFHAFFSLGGLAGAALGGLLIGRGLGDGTGYAAAGLAGLATVGWIARRLLAHGADGHAGSHFALPRRAALGIGLLALMCMVVEGAAADWSALHMVQNAGVSAAWAGSAYAAYSVAMAAVRFAGDGAIARWGHAPVMRASGLLVAAGLFVAATLPLPAVVVAGFVLVGVGAANVVPILFGAAARLPGLPPGVGVAAVATVGYTGFLAGPPFIGMLAEDIGLGASLGLLGLCGLAIAAGARVAAGR